MTRLSLVPDISVSSARRMVAESLRRHGIESPELDARLLIGHVLGLDLTGLVVQAERALTRTEVDAITALATRRLAHEPIARILGMKEFWGLPLLVTAAVLVPRPETETVVEAALAAIETRGSRTRPWRIADLGTGSGALLLALLSELPCARGVGTDRSIAALAVAKENAVRLGLAGRAGWVGCDQGAALSGGWDLVVANPPYVASDDIATLAPEVRDFCPHLALDGGRDGLDAYRVIAADATRLLAVGGSVIVELGIGQAHSVSDLFTAAGLGVDWPARADLAGIPRALWGRHNP